MKNKIIIIIIFAIILIIILCLISYIVGAYYFSPEKELEEFCLQALDYPNYYNLTPEEHKAYSLSNLVRDTLFYSDVLRLDSNRSFEPLDIIERKVDDCNGHSSLFFSCCLYLDLDCAIQVYNFNETSVHLFNSVLINNTRRTLDSTVTEKYDILLFLGYRKNITTNWDKIFKMENENGKIKQDITKQ